MFYDNGDDVSSIVSKKLFALAMDRLEKNKYAPSSYKADERYLLTSKLMCGDCGALMVGEGGTSQSGKVYHYYKCVTAKKSVVAIGRRCGKKPLKN